MTAKAFEPHMLCAAGVGRRPACNVVACLDVSTLSLKAAGLRRSEGHKWLQAPPEVCSSQVCFRQRTLWPVLVYAQSAHASAQTCHKAQGATRLGSNSIGYASDKRDLACDGTLLERQLETQAQTCT